MTRSIRLWRSHFLFVAGAMFAALASSLSAQDPWVIMSVDAQVGYPGKPFVWYALSGSAYASTESVIGKITGFELNYPNGGGKVGQSSISGESRFGFCSADFPDLKSIPAGDYTIALTGSIGGTKTYKVNVNPSYSPGPVKTQFVDSARAILETAPLTGFSSLNLQDPLSNATMRYVSLGAYGKGTLFSEQGYRGGLSIMMLPMFMLTPGQAAYFQLQYTNMIPGGDGIYVYYNTSYTVEFTAAPPQAPTRLGNISVRGYCGTNDRVTIGGFVVGGTANKRVLVRALGPTLTASGLGQSEVLLDPTIEVYKNADVIAANDNWGSNSNAEDITATATRIGAGSIGSGDATSSALLLTLSPGVYSFIARGKLGTSGIALLEVYDADPDTSRGRFMDISARAYSTAGNGVAIGGFVISGSTPKQVLLRAVGPTLTKLGIQQADVLVDPTIELHDASHGNVVIATNDNWGQNANAAAITSTSARIGANALDAADTNSAALLLTLAPGAYTFVAAGKNSTSGIVLVEVYDAD